MKEELICEWCKRECDLKPMLIPETPILEWFEEKLVALGDMDDEEIHLTPQEEQEMDTYDYMINSYRTGSVCSSCWGKEQLLWEKYYKVGDDIDDFLEGLDEFGNEDDD